ncbi:MAG: GNAT family N-acetyltransferase [Taibaiella sp.]|nr:GNAT family N-acetyltransferase [Taibaiella sp.]
MNWIQHPVVLEGERVRLVPLERQHFTELVNVANDARIWEYTSIDGTDENRIRRHLESAVLKRGTGEQYPFTVIDRQSGRIIGSTMFHNIFPEHRKLEIGWTWYDPAFWRTGYNRECKLLLLTHCFEVMNTIRVQLVTDETNWRSRQAILGIGASMEGILRNDRIRENGKFRNTVVYSIVCDEWHEVKSALESKLLRQH